MSGEPNELEPREQKKKRKKPANFNQITVRLLESNGWVIGWTEYYEAFGGVKHDFLGFADCIATHPVRRDTVAIQVTSTHNRNARRKKILSKIAAVRWLMGGNKIWVLHWELQGKEWFPTKEDLTLADFPPNRVRQVMVYNELKTAVAKKEIETYKMKSVRIDL